MNDKALLRLAVDAAIAGSKEILEVYQKDFKVEFKEDRSPLTLADRNAHKAISNILESSGLPILSEEGRHLPYEARKTWHRFWLVDPLDGTKEFIKRNNEFTVNIALIEHGKPVLGVILVPVGNTLFFASHASGAFKMHLDDNIVTDIDKLVGIADRLPIDGGLKAYTVVGSRSHLSPETLTFIEKLRGEEPDLDFVSIGSSLKLCLVAEGKAHIYPRFGPTMEWDTAAGHALLEIAGGKVVLADSGKPMLYNKPDLLNPWFIASRPK